MGILDLKDFDFSNCQIVDANGNVKELGLADFFPKESVFTPKYPQRFSFDLIVENKNYGKINIEIKRGIEISSLTGDKVALKKIEEIGKKQVNNKTFYYNLCSSIPIFITYPFKDAECLIAALLEGETGFLKTAEFNDFNNFINKVLYPIDEQLLIKNGELPVF